MKILGWCFLIVTVVFGYWRSMPIKAISLASVKTPIVYAGNFHLKDFPQTLRGAKALYPLRAGRKGEAWDLRNVLATGSRSPLPADAPRVPLERAYVSEPGPQLADRIKSLHPGERLLIVGMMSEGDHGGMVPQADGRKFGEAVLIGEGVPEGLLTTPSVRFRPGLVAATDIAAIAEGSAFGAGRPAVVVPGAVTVEVLEHKREIWRYGGAQLLVILPWLLTPLLILGVWKKWEWPRRLSLAIPLGMLVGSWCDAWLLRGAVALIVVGLGTWKLTVRQMALSVALVLWAGATLGYEPLEYHVFSYSLAEAARFYGIGNEGAGLLIGCALVAGFEGPGLLAVALAIGLPTLGANNGCALAALVALALTGTSRRAQVLWALVGVLVVVGTVRWERSRSAQVQTHLGKTVSGSGESRLGMVGRKLAMNGYLLVRSPWTLLLLATGVLAGRQRKTNALGTALTALALNDSGVLAAATVLLPVATESEPTQKEQSPLVSPTPEG